MKVPLLDLPAQYRSLKPDIDAAVARALENATFILGPDVIAFENDFAAYSGAKFGIGVNSGTSALHLALLAAGVGPGDEVITTPFTFVATVATIRYTGARPVFVDIDRTTFNIDPNLIEAAVSPRTKAIVPVHLYGQCADMDPILEIARRHNLTVIEDAAQAHGAEYKGRRAGSLAPIACFSFYPGKNLGAYGEGGMVTTSDSRVAETIRKMRDWGGSKRYYHDIVGFNYRLEGIQGAILRVKLPYLDAWTEARRRNAALYNEMFGGCVVTPIETLWARHVWHCYVVRVPAAARDRLVEHLAACGIAAGVYYPIPLHLQQAHADLGYREGRFPIAEQVAKEVIALPVHPHLSEEQVRFVADTLADYLM